MRSGGRRRGEQQQEQLQGGRVATSVTANWLATPAKRSLMPGAVMSFLFSEPLKAAKALPIIPKRSARSSNLSLYAPSASFLREAKATPATMKTRQTILGLDGLLP